MNDDDRLVVLEADRGNILMAKKKDIDRVETELKARLERMDNKQAMNALLNLSTNNPNARYGKMGVMGVDYASVGFSAEPPEEIPGKTATVYPVDGTYRLHWSGDSTPDTVPQGIKFDQKVWQQWVEGRRTTFPKADRVPEPEFDIEQLMNMAQLSQTPSLQRAVDGLATVIKRLAEKYKLGPIASLALVKMVEVNVFQALVGAINEQHNGDEGVKDD